MPANAAAYGKDSGRAVGGDDAVNDKVGDMQNPAENPDEPTELAFADLVRAQQVSSLPTPVVGTPMLPLSDLDPEVLERLAAEMVKRRLNDGAHFYGRRGQKQYGLDIVEREISGRVTVYQVRRYAELTPAKIADAVAEYADPQPPKTGGPKPSRRFNADKYVLLTSALFEDEAALQDKLTELQRQYFGDLVIDVWGREKVSGELRDSGALVNSVFGPEWAWQFCGFAPPPAPPRAPDRLGLVDDPVLVIGNLDALAADAKATEASDPLGSARLYGIIAATLAEANFPAHAAAQRLRQAHLLKDNGDTFGAFDVFWELERAHFMSGEVGRSSVYHALDELRPRLPPTQTAKLDVLQAAQDWYEQGCLFSVAVPALETLVSAADPDAALLGCITVEQALVDGWHDFDPPAALVDPGGNDRNLLDRLLACTSGLSIADVELRARLNCARADVSLRLGYTSEEAESAYGELIRNAGAGRYRHADGLIAARAARAFALCGGISRAIEFWRTSIMMASESGLYGDVIACRRAINAAVFEQHKPDLADLGYAGSLPNENRLLAATQSAELGALQAAHAGQLPDAFGVARRWFWEARLAGQLAAERDAMSMFGDVLLAAGRTEVAVTAWVMAGEADKAARHAATCGTLLDMTPWLTSPARRLQSAAARVVGEQSSLYRSDGRERVVHQLIAIAGGIWDSLRIAPNPALDAVNALCRFGRYLPASAAEPILAVLAPALEPGQTLAPETLSLLIQVYWAVPDRRDSLAAIISAQLSRTDPPPGLWGFVSNIPKPARAPLAFTVSALAEQGNLEALLALAAWRVSSPTVQFAARSACAELLRRPDSGLTGSWSFSRQCTDTAVLLSALASADTVSDVDPRDLRPGVNGSLGRTAGSMTQPDLKTAITNMPDADSQGSQTPPGEVQSADWIPDQPAIIAAGRPMDVAEAVVRCFLRIATHENEPAFTRTDALVGIRTLIPHLPSWAVYSNLAERLVELAGNPRFNEFDQVELQSQDPLSRGRLNMGASQLPALALLIAAETAEAAAKSDPALECLSVNRLQGLAISSASFLKSPDQQIAKYAAGALAHASKVNGSLAGFGVSLITSPSEDIRKIAAFIVNLDETSQLILAADPAPQVRVTLARRARELTPQVLDTLRRDTNAEVVEALTAATAAEPAISGDTSGTADGN